MALPSTNRPLLMTPSRFASIDLFSNLTAADLAPLDAVAEFRTYDAGQIIMLENEIGAYVYFVLRGVVRAFRTNLDGREQTLIHLEPGQAFNLPTAFTSQPLTPASAVALGKVELLRVRFEDFRQIATHTPLIANVVLRDLSNKLHHFTNLTHDLSLRSVRARLAQFLLRELPPGENAVLRQWTQEEIGAQIGTVREVVSRTLRAFVNEGLITIERHEITLIDVGGLEDLTET
jgi:CRP-like cAMP-binding protein